MGGSLSAELLKLRRRPATWVLGIIWFSLALFFGYAIPYLVYRLALNDPTVDVGAPPADLLRSILPENLISNGVSGFPLFGGAIALILGALVTGSEYGWGTLKTILTQRPTRLSVFVGKLLALGLVLIAFVLAVFVPGAIISFIIGQVENATMNWPSAWEVARGLGASWLILAAWASFGMLLAILFRGTALAIGLGLVWVLVIENLVRGVSFLLEFLETVYNGLLGANAGSVAAAFASTVQGEDAPGVVTAVGPTQATLVVIAYTVVFILLSALVFRQRDVA